jgi:predicted metal-binding membrane protein
MNEPSLEALLKRDRAVVLVSLVATATLAWAYVIWLEARMSASMPAAMPDMPGMAMGPAIRPWSGPELFFAFAMWAVMMVGMMLPSAAPMILLYARVGRQAESEGKPFAATSWFAAGYLLAWTGFAAVASLAQAGLLAASLVTPMLVSANNAFGGIVLIAAGLYQWTPAKNACLSSCQSPFAFIQRHGGFKRDARGALRLGLRHGLYCIGCCWALMALLFVGGVMNLLWIALLSVWVLLEKAVLTGRVMSRAVGLALVTLGLIFLYRTVT